MTSTSRPTRALVATLAVAALLGVAACSGSDAKKKSSSPPPATPTPTTSTPAKPPVNAVNPYTGIGAVPKTPTISVKIDDTEAGRPQVGIDKADIVYIEQVEGGLSRLAAIFGTNKPTVGYVRSTRPSDPDLLLQFGKITAAYSGGAHDSLPRIHASGITSWSQDDGSAYYTRVPHAGDHGYINVELNLAQVAQHTKTTKPKDMGFRFSASQAQLKGAPAATDIRTVVGQTNVEFKYSYQLKKYIRYIDGQRQVAADGKPVATTNVIVQQCKVVPHPQDTDVNGNPSQFTYTTGKGAMSVFRNGHRINGTWLRGSTSSGTYLHTNAGKTLYLAPGNTWVALVHTGTATTG